MTLREEVVELSKTKNKKNLKKKKKYFHGNEELEKAPDIKYCEDPNTGRVWYE